jgi:hypothetical protein
LSEIKKILFTSISTRRVQTEIGVPVYEKLDLQKKNSFIDNAAKDNVYGTVCYIDTHLVEAVLKFRGLVGWVDIHQDEARLGSCKLKVKKKNGHFFFGGGWGVMLSMK